MPVELMPRMQDESKVANAVRPQQSTAIHHSCDTVEALRDLDIVDGGIDCRKSAEHLFYANSGGKRSVLLRIERLGLRHASRHSQQDHGVSRGLDLLGTRCLHGRAAGQRG